MLISYALKTLISAGKQQYLDGTTIDNFEKVQASLPGKSMGEPNLFIHL